MTIKTAAVERPELFGEAAEMYGSQCICVPIDTKATHEGSEAKRTGEDGRRRRCRRMGARGGSPRRRRENILTSMDRDGTRIAMTYRSPGAVSEAVIIPVIASKASTLEHLYKGLVDGKADAVLAASIFHYREHMPVHAKKDPGSQRGSSSLL